MIYMICQMAGAPVQFSGDALDATLNLTANVRTEL
jgi:hypothetical protein